MSPFNDDEISHFKEAFHRFDKDGNGYIATSGLGDVLSHLGLKFSEGELQGVIHEVDKESKGIIDFQEFSSIIQKIKDVDSEQELRDGCFEVFDTDQSGYLTIPELKNFMKNLDESITYEEVVEIFNQADTDGDGKVDYQEFVNLMSG